MMLSQLHKRIVALTASCLTLGLLVAPTPAKAANPALGSEVVATLTAKHGTVFKRAFRDWNREQWGDPESAEVSDQLREGMQIGTGNESWAEVTWPNVKTRAWANTVFAVAPNKRLVYLTGGEMLFRLDKNRKDKDDYYIWTKVLQARIRGTTVLVQAKGPVTRFTVMEGIVEVKNRLDNSRSVLRPGVVYEIKGYNMTNRAPLPSVGGGSSGNNNAGTGQTEPYTPTPLAVPKNFDGSIKDVAYDSQNFLPVFQDKFSTTNVYAANSNALLNHPLVTGAKNKNDEIAAIDSMALIQDAQRELPGYNKVLPIKLADTARLNKVIFSNVEPVAVPSKADYFVGQSVGKGLKMPAAAYGDLPPKGVVLNPSLAAEKSAPPPTTAVVPKMPAMVLPTGLLLPVPDDTSKATVFEEDPTPQPQVNFNQTDTMPGKKLDALQSNQVPGVVPGNCAVNGGLNGAPITSSAFQPLPGSLPQSSVPTINGIIAPGSIGGFTPSGNVVPGFGGGTGGGGLINGAGGGSIGNALGGVGPGLGNGLGGPGNGVGNGVGGVLNNAANNLNLGR